MMRSVALVETIYLWRDICLQITGQLSDTVPDERATPVPGLLSSCRDIPSFKKIWNTNDFEESCTNPCNQFCRIFR
ncbi:hypothetical protein Plhal304r1_c015g0055251 [Plasmopara halstedii]